MSVQPLAIDLFCGLGGWTEGLLAHGYYVIGFDIERHEYGDSKYPAQLVLQDILTIHGSQFKDAALIVASPPCQEFSYMAMPWSLAKEKRARLLHDAEGRKRLTALFDACFRIQREASEAAGHHIPMVVENVRGAQEWVGRSRWNFGSFHLWGDVPALMPMQKAAAKVPMPAGGDSLTIGFQQMANLQAREGIKAAGMNWSDPSKRGQDFTRIAGRQAEHNENGNKGFGSGLLGKNPMARMHGSKSKARKAASAQIAKIPFVLSSYIGEVFKPGRAA